MRGKEYRLPSIRAPMVDSNGQATKEFYDFFRNIVDTVIQVSTGEERGSLEPEASDGAEAKSLADNLEVRFNSLEELVNTLRDPQDFKAEIDDIRSLVQTIDERFSVRRTYEYNVTPPSFGTLVTVPTVVTERAVWASIELEGGASASEVDAEVETGLGTGAYEIATTWRRAPGGSLTILPGSFVVEGGRRYRFVETETGGTRTISHLSYRDIIET